MTPPLLPSFTEAVRVWLRIGLLSFGGPAAQIAMLHREVVERRGWVGERRFLHALSFCTLLPGPEAMQLATYLGWLMHGVAGGVAAGLLFVLPGAGVLLGLSILFVTVGHVPAIEGAFFGLKCAVLALVIQAVPRIGRRALKTRTAWGMAAMAFAALFFLAAPFPAVVLVAGAVGAAAPGRFGAAAGEATDASDGLIDRVLRADPGRPGRQAARARLAGAAAAGLWLAPVALLAALAPGRFADIAWFFSKMAVVTLGGAYAVLAYAAQDAVQSLHWLRPSDMLTGLGLAETTPGPLILVLQFVGFLAGFSAPGRLHGLAGGLAAAALTLWVTFLPCFAFVFIGAPAVESLAANRKLNGALAAVTAAVVGVIANLALWFAEHLLFAATMPFRAGLVRCDVPLPGSLDPIAAVLALLAALCLFRLHWRAPPMLALAATAGLLMRLIL